MRVVYFLEKERHLDRHTHSHGWAGKVFFANATALIALKPVRKWLHHHHHHHLWDDSQLWAIAFLGFPDNRIFTGWGLSTPRPTPNLEEQASVFITPGDRVTQLYPQALGTHFSRLLRHAWATMGLFLPSGHHTEKKVTHDYRNRLIF
jgi:hypothetical protein